MEAPGNPDAEIIFHLGGVVNIVFKTQSYYVDIPDELSFEFQELVLYFFRLDIGSAGGNTFTKSAEQSFFLC